LTVLSHDMGDSSAQPNVADDVADAPRSGVWWHACTLRLVSDMGHPVRGRSSAVVRRLIGASAIALSSALNQEPRWRWDGMVFRPSRSPPQLLRRACRGLLQANVRVLQCRRRGPPAATSRPFRTHGDPSQAAERRDDRSRQLDQWLLVPQIRRVGAAPDRSAAGRENRSIYIAETADGSMMARPP
jgi:hypothetical protein